MQIKEKDARRELKVLSVLIYNSRVLTYVADQIEPECFQSSFSYKIALKCKQHYTKYHKSPSKEIHDYIEGVVSSSKDEVEIANLQKILHHVSSLRRSVRNKAKDAYLLDLVRKHFRENKLSILLNNARDSLDAGDVSKVEDVLNKARISLRPPQYVNIDPQNPTFIETVLKAREKSIIPLEGALAKFFGPHLRKENFVAFQGAEKSFKSTWLLELSYRALKAKLKVFFVGICDMSASQYAKRFYSRLLGRPWLKGSFYVPVDWKPTDGPIQLPKFKKKYYDTSVTKSQVVEVLEKFTQKYLGGKLSSYLKFFSVGDISVSGIISLLEQLKGVEGWIPDLIVVDYADRISPPKHTQDKLTQIDFNWSQLREMAFTYNALVVTATQGRRSIYKGFLQTRDDVADQKTKTGLVTGMVGLCATEEELKLHVRRLNWIVCREQTTHYITTAACPEISNPCILSK